MYSITRPSLHCTCTSYIGGMPKIYHERYEETNLVHDYTSYIWTREDIKERSEDPYMDQTRRVTFPTTLRSILQICEPTIHWAESGLAANIFLPHLSLMLNSSSLKRSFVRSVKLQLPTWRSREMSRTTTAMPR